jgi:hypothetical protein
MKPAHGEVDIYSYFMDQWYTGKAAVTTTAPPSAEAKPGQA